jgi:hypothetical protein
VLTRIIRNRLISLFHDTLIGKYQEDSGKEDLYVNDGTEAKLRTNPKSDKNDLDRYAEQNLSRRKTIGKFWRKHRSQTRDPLSTMLFNALITRSKKEIEKALSKLEKAAWDYGLRIKDEKTKYVII